MESPRATPSSAPGAARSYLCIFQAICRTFRAYNCRTWIHGIYALTPVRAAFVPHEAIRAMTRANARLNDVLVRYALIDASIFRQWIASIGRRTAYERIAHLFCEVFVRMRVLGLAQRDSFQLPMTQAELGDAMGLSPVHVNRVLQRLRKEGLISSRGDVHAISDWERLRAAGDFSEDYLHLRKLEPDET